LLSICFVDFSWYSNQKKKILPRPTSTSIYISFLLGIPWFPVLCLYY
jgi:hypothetical protein